MEERIVMLVEDNPDDVELTLRAFKKNNILNRVIVAKDGVEALDVLFGTGTYAGRELKELRSSTPCPEGDMMRRGVSNRAFSTLLFLHYTLSKSTGQRQMSI